MVIWCSGNIFLLSSLLKTVVLLNIFVETVTPFLVYTVYIYKIL